VQEIVNIEPLLGMTFAPYCYGGSEPSNNKDSIILIELCLMGKMRMIEMIGALS
jgi:hypothetical protein